MIALRSTFEGDSGTTVTTGSAFDSTGPAPWPDTVAESWLKSGDVWFARLPAKADARTQRFTRRITAAAVAAGMRPGVWYHVEFDWPDGQCVITRASMLHPPARSDRANALHRAYARTRLARKGRR